jgi:hypothetical protein
VTTIRDPLADITSLEAADYVSNMCQQLEVLSTRCGLDSLGRDLHEVVSRARDLTARLRIARKKGP